MRILIVTAGSAGDVAPYTGLGVRLRDEGHEVAIATHSPFEDMVRACGLGFRALPFDPRAVLASAAGQRLARVGNGPRALAQAVRIGRAVIGEVGRGVVAAAEQGTDVLVSSTTMSRLAYTVAEGMGIPLLGVYLQPVAPTVEFPPLVIATRSLGRGGNRAAGHAVLALSDRAYASAMDELRAQLGLSRNVRAGARHRETGGSPVQHAFSPTVVPRPADWAPGLEVAGYLWPARPAGWRPDPLLVDFLDAGPPPVCVGLGSMVAGDPERLVEIAMTAFHAAGVRGVIQTGWSGLTAVGDDVLTVAHVPHDWLFPRMAAVVHAAGAGTTAAGLRAGVPAVPVPAQLDQPFWAARLSALGVTPGPVPFRHLTAKRLAEAVRRAVDDPAYRLRARHVADRIAGEDGAGKVVAAIRLLPASAAGPYGRPSRTGAASRRQHDKTTSTWSEKFGKDQK